MNPDKDPFMGQIPRKKLPPVPQTSSASAAAKAEPPPRPENGPRRTTSNAASSSSNKRSTSHSPPPPAARRSRGSSPSKKNRVRIVQESPLIVRINIKGIPFDMEGIPRQRSSARAPKRKRPAYQEVQDTDSDDFLTDSDQDDIPKAKKQRATSPYDVSSMTGTELSNEDQIMVSVDPNAVDAPPPGVLNTLWYSRESFLHIFVLERVCGWKTRVKVQLVDSTESKAPVTLEKTEATALQQKILTNPSFWFDVRKRMEVSRIHPTHCPVVLAMAALQEEELAKQNNTAPKYTLQTVSEDREEVLLVKWRGRSHWHCSWERATDIQRFDPSNNTARNKIKRFYASQEMAYGANWKQVLEEERQTAATIHAHGGDAEEEADQEEYFAPQFLEVERILACDENEMNMKQLALQRALNIKAEQDALKRREEEASSKMEEATKDTLDDKHTRPIRNMVKDIVDVNKKEEPWDPEDNVRYVVKWKGLPFAEMTWEYWRDIKQDAVDEAEDFWHRQKPPELDKVRTLANRPHPHIRDFRKLQVSANYGISQRDRPVADLGDGPLVNSAEDDEGDSFKFQLRSYQLEGVNWLLFNWWNKRSCILADEMGLGKTIQSAAFLQELQSLPATQVRGPFLIVAPLSLVGQWQSELASWAPDLNVVLYHGSADARDFLVQQEFWYTDQFVPKPTAVKLKKLNATKFHVLITTYEVALKDIAVLSRIKWKVLIVDEAHRLKNPKARLFEQLATVPRDYCVLLTGTPIANATEELWALLNFANPSHFANKDKFLGKFGEVTEAKQVKELHTILKPYLLRRVKEDVEKSLPPKEETILEVSLTPIQKTFYKAIYERNTSFLFKGAKPSNAPSLMNVMMELRKCCNHPYLVKGAEERILADAAAKLKEKKDESGNEIPIDHLKLFADQLVKSSGKMVLMEKLLQKLFAGGHKVLVFSQMVRVLDLLEELLRLKKYKYERLDGSTSSSSRAAAVDRFNRKSCQRFVMLLSTRAGGLGLNLTAADIVIIFDSDWNPQNDLQAMARAHRIGQTRAVRVYRLLTAKTYEMHMFHSASLKLGLERAVLSQNRDQSDESDDNKSKKKSDREAQAKEIDELLKKGAYDVFRDEDDAEAEKFMETDIDQLLEHKSKKVTYGASATSSLGSGLGSFSKASFVADTGDGEKDLDLDDPDFWSKAVGLEAPPQEVPEDVAAMLDDGVKRSRKQVQVYDPYAETAEAEQRKKDKIAMEKMLEKEEKERLKLEKVKKKKEAKEKKKREREEKGLNAETKSATSKEPKMEAKKVIAEIKPKKTKKNDRQRALRRAENEDPVIERLKQAWEVPQRNRATAAAIRFGFGRFCKIRSESNLTSLPLQDLEVFVRSYVYQLSLQVAVTLLAKLRDGRNGDSLRPMFQEWLGIRCSRELDWLCDSVLRVMNFHMEVENQRRFLRMPVILAEPAFVADLRRGGAFRALRRIGVLVRINRFIEDCLDSILDALGHQELGRRGCATSDLSTLDVDLKARYVTTEELALAVGSVFQHNKLKAPAAWWDRRCDVALIIGTFVHGLGNYEGMRNDTDLPFADKIRRNSAQDEACRTANQIFRTAAVAARQVFDDALEAARIKAELEVQAAVAAAAKAASKREEDAALLRKGGAEAEAVISNMPDTQVENAFEFDGTDSHFVTLSRMQKYVQDAVRKEVPLLTTSSASPSVEVLPDLTKSEEEVESETQEEGAAPAGRGRDRPLLPMPDARVLDCRLVRLLKTIENVAYADEEVEEEEESNPDLWEKSDDVLTNCQMRSQALSKFVGDEAADLIYEYSGVGLGASQCGTSHRSLNDGSDFGFGSASSQLAQVAYGTDAPRFLRAIGVPINVTRFAISGLVYADPSCVEQLLVTEKLRYYGNKEGKPDHPKDAEASGVAQSETKADKPKQEEPDPTKQPKQGEQQKQEEPDSAEQPKQEESDPTGPPIEKNSAEIAKDPNAAESSSKGDQAGIPEPVDPVEYIPAVFRENAKLRASICLAVIYYGFPSESLASGPVDQDLLGVLLQHNGSPDNIIASSLFNLEKFREAVKVFAQDVPLPDPESIREYVESFLLPHCLRLCVNGNGPTTRGARGSQGEYETAFGVSLHAEPSAPHPSPLPDPCLTLQQHSLEALGQANALLRRVRLLRACQFLCSGKGISSNTIQAITRSKTMGMLQSMPVWWCPWIHDLALLLQAATGGLFSVIPNRAHHAIFSSEALQQYLYSSFVAEEKTLPAVKQTPPEQVAAWTEQQAKKFPSLNQLERRMAFLCSRATAEVECEVRYDNLPFFDHGGLPRN